MSHLTTISLSRVAYTNIVYNYAVPSSACVRPLHMSNALRLSRTLGHGLAESFPRGRGKGGGFEARLSRSDDDVVSTLSGPRRSLGGGATYHHVPSTVRSADLGLPVGAILSRHCHLGDRRDVCPAPCTGAPGLDGNYHSQVSGRPAADRPCVTIGCTMTAVMRHRRYVTSPVPGSARARAQRERRAPVRRAHSRPFKIGPRSTRDEMQCKVNTWIIWKDIFLGRCNVIRF